MNFIGFLGPVMFETSSMLGRTFQNFQRQRKVRYAVHDIVNGNQVLQHLGDDLSELTIKMHLANDLLTPFGTSPRLEMEALALMMAAGSAWMLLIGIVPLGKYVIQEMNETWTRVNNHGAVTAADVEVKLKEYA